MVDPHPVQVSCKWEPPFKASMQQIYRIMHPMRRHAKWRTEAIATGSAQTHIPVVFNPVSVFSLLPYEDEKKHESQTTAATKCLRLRMQQCNRRFWQKDFSECSARRKSPVDPTTSSIVVITVESFWTLSTQDKYSQKPRISHLAPLHQWEQSSQRRR